MNTRKKSYPRHIYLQDSDSEDDVSLASRHNGQDAVVRTKHKSTKRKRTNKQSAPTNSKSVTSDNNIYDSVTDSFQKNIENKVNNFFESRNLLSDDEDKILTIRKNEAPKPVIKELYILSDSKDEFPSTSEVNNDSLKESKAEEPTNSKDKDTELMEIVDRILDCDDVNLEDSIINVENTEVDNWNEFESKADEIIGSVTAILDTLKGDKPTTKCPVCLEILNGDIIAGSTVCGHIFCMGCIQQVAKTTKNCPTCRKRIKVKDIHPLYL